MSFEFEPNRTYCILPYPIFKEVLPYLIIQSKIFAAAIYPNGKYINNKFNLCHNPSCAIHVFSKDGLSDITNNIKNKSVSTKETINKAPVILWCIRNESVDKSSGTNTTSIKPMAEPTPCILEAVVTIFLVSLTLKKHVKIHAPIANTKINTTSVMVIGLDTDI